MKIKNHYLLVLTLIILTKSFSQESPQPMASVETDMPEISHASPTVAGLMKFEESPVNNYTGVPDISVPLYSVESISKNIKIDLSLKYHPSSIAVKEIAGYTGLGWSLFAGGSISRTVRGTPDEVCRQASFPNNFHNIDNKAQIGIYHNNLSDPYTNKYYEVLDLIGTLMNPSQRETVSKYMWYAFEKGILDSEHDLYQFNFMGHTGRFYLKMTSTGNLEVVKLDNNNSIRVELNYTYDNNQQEHKYNFIGFTVFDDKGYKYVFDTKEVTTESSATSNQSFKMMEPPATTFVQPVSYVSSYQLSKIYDNNENLVAEFMYSNSSELIADHTSIDYSIQPSTLQSQIVNYLNDQYNNYEIIGLLPKSSITVKNRTIETKKLHQINVINKAKIEFTLEQGREDSRLNSTSHKLKSIIVKDWSNTSIKKFDFVYGYFGGSNNKRLCLEKVTEKNFTDNKDLSYEFMYKLKNFSSFNYDYWGYAKSGTGKDTEPTYCTANALEKMLLPTGGYVKFNFGSNTYSYIGDQQILDFSEGVDWIYYSDPPKTLTNNGGIVTQSIGTLNKQRIVSYTHSVSPNTTNYAVKIVDDQSIPASSIDNSEYLLEANKEYFVQFEWFDISQTGTLTINLNYRTPPDILNEFVYGGGVRINSIAYYESESETLPVRTKNYSYNFFDNPSKSSGSLAFAKPVFKYTRNVKSYSPQLSLGDITYKVSGDFNNLTPLRTQGSDVGYRNVTVTEGSLQNNGKSEYTYKSPIDYPEEYYTIQHPFLPSWNYDYKRGLLTNEKHYKWINHSNYQILSETDYVYNWDKPEYNSNNDEDVIRTGLRGYNFSGCPKAGEYNLYGNFVSCLNNTGCSLGWGDGCNLENYLSFAEIKEAYGWSKLMEKTTKEYFYEGSSQNIVETTETFNYNTANKKISEHTLGNSLGENLKTNYYYDTNHADRNRIGMIKKIESRRNSTLLETKDINYVNTFTGNTSYLPQTISVSKGTNTLETRIQYVEYDEYSNPLEVKQEDGIHIVYLWGYNQAYPIAKIENATYSQVTGALGTTNISEANLAAINNLRTNSSFTNAMITTYTYKPLVGVTSVTDPRGYKTTYHYDSFGRLEFVKDADENILEENKHHYRTQN